MVLRDAQVVLREARLLAPLSEREAPAQQDHDLSKRIKSARRNDFPLKISEKTVH